MAMIMVAGLNRAVIAQMKWTSFEHLSDSMRAHPKPVMVFIYTDWCKFCALQKKNTFTDPQVIKATNASVYALKLNAESKDDIEFLGRTYRYVATGATTGEHQLARLLGEHRGQLSYPTTVWLTPQFKVAGRMPGFVDAATLLKLVNALTK